MKKKKRKGSHAIDKKSKKVSKKITNHANYQDKMHAIKKQKRNQENSNETTLSNHQDKILATKKKEINQEEMQVRKERNNVFLLGRF